MQKDAQPAVNEVTHDETRTGAIDLVLFLLFLRRHFGAIIRHLK